MIFYSQHDPAYDRLPLGPSQVTVHGFGCFLCSIATLYQVSPKNLLKVPGAFNAEGDLIAAILAKACGGTYLGIVKDIFGWGIAMTDFYAHLGYPTHFFCVNLQTREMIDPLKFPAKIEPLTYNITQLRDFTGIRLGVIETPSPSILSLFIKNPVQEESDINRRIANEKDPILKSSMERLMDNVRALLHLS